MKITSVKTGGFANGFGCFCADCGRFFSVQFLEGNVVVTRPADEVEYCPYCGEGNILFSVEELLDHLADHDTDPVNFYHAFPHGEQIPNSRTGATPKQVEWILGCVISDRWKKIPVTAKSLADQLGYSKEVVTKVFEELHIPETGGAE